MFDTSGVVCVTRQTPSTRGQSDAVFESRRDSTFIDNELNIITIPIGIALQECSKTLVSFIIFVIYYKCSTPPVSYVLPVKPRVLGVKRMPYLNPGGIPHLYRMNLI